jgi:acyl-[acyl-carrier-protein]-phospholipid O-acyltransferase/long-chain-fatty-acid--[acyl-carrier-protein] ligase
VVAALMSGRTPVMINYSTGAAQNCEMAQRRLAFRTVITSRALLEKIKCPLLDGMVCIEDLAAGVTTVDKIGGLLRSKMSADRICRHVHLGAELLLKLARAAFRTDVREALFEMARPNLQELA